MVGLFLLALSLSDISQYDCGPADLMILSAPPPSVRLLHPLQNRELTIELLRFARRRPYADSIPGYWDENYIRTEDLAQQLQGLEELERTLPDLDDCYRFPCPEILYSQIQFGDQYFKNLFQRARFMLTEEQMIVQKMYEDYLKIKVIYFMVINTRCTYNCYISKKEMLADLKKEIGEENYKKGIIPKLLPDIILH